VVSAIIEANAVSKSFGRQEVLRQVSLDVGAGEVVCLLGRNGAGKTTLLRVMMGTLLPQSGVVTYQQRPLAVWGRAYYRQIGAVLEGVDNTYAFLSGWHNLVYLGALSGLSKRQVVATCGPYLETLGLVGHVDKKAGDYSLGMRQKLAVVAALMGHPRLVFLDEPTLGLDVVSKRQVVQFVQDLARDQGVSFLITSHQSDVIDTVADRIALIDQGRIQFGGSRAEFLDRFAPPAARLRLGGTPAEVRRALALLRPLVGDGIGDPTRDSQVVELRLAPADGPPALALLAEQGLGAVVQEYRRGAADVESGLLAAYQRLGHG
jgi:ABC-2 type transport system ATP-binding protein